MLAALLALGPQVLPLIEALLRQAPELIADVKAIIAAVEGNGPSPNAGKDVSASMAAADDMLKKFAGG